MEQNSQDIPLNISFNVPWEGKQNKQTWNYIRVSKWCQKFSFWGEQPQVHSGSVLWRGGVSWCNRCSRTHMFLLSRVRYPLRTLCGALCSAVMSNAAVSASPPPSSSYVMMFSLTSSSSKGESESLFCLRRDRDKALTAREREERERERKQGEMKRKRVSVYDSIYKNGGRVYVLGDKFLQ